MEKEQNKTGRLLDKFHQNMKKICVGLGILTGLGVCGTVENLLDGKMEDAAEAAAATMVLGAATGGVYLYGRYQGLDMSIKGEKDISFDEIDQQIQSNKLKPHVV